MIEELAGAKIRKLSDSVYFVGDDRPIKVMISREGKLRCMCGEYHRTSRCAHVDVVYVQELPARPDLKRPVKRSHEIDDLADYRKQIHVYLSGAS